MLHQLVMNEKQIEFINDIIMCNNYGMKRSIFNFLEEMLVFLACRRMKFEYWSPTI